MRNPKDFFRPLAVGAPEPVREIPFRPSRMIHFFPARTRRWRPRCPTWRPRSTCSSANLEDAVPAADKEAARAGLVEDRQEPPTSATPSSGPG